MRDALIVFAKLPVAGTVKTRLTALLSPEEAARLYAAFLNDAFAQYSSLPVDVRLYLSPSFKSVPAGLTHQWPVVKAQEGSGLGARMKHAFITSFAEGYERLVIIGTDHPTLPTAFINYAFESLTPSRSVCIGPSDDGGFYLLGMNDYYPELFHEMTYSHEDVFNETLLRAESTPADVTILPPWYDVDTPESLYRLIRDLADPSVVAPSTRQVIAALQVAYPSVLHPPE